MVANHHKEKLLFFFFFYALHSFTAYNRRWYSPFFFLLSFYSEKKKCSRHSLFFFFSILRRPVNFFPFFFYTGQPSLTLIYSFPSFHNILKLLPFFFFNLFPLIHGLSSALSDERATHTRLSVRQNERTSGMLRVAGGRRYSSQIRI